MTIRTRRETIVAAGGIAAGIAGCFGSPVGIVRADVPDGQHIGVVRDPDGVPESVTIDVVSIDVEWEHLTDDPDEIAIYVDTEYGRLVEHSVSGDWAADDSTTVDDVPEASLFDTDADPLDFTVDEDGDEKEFTVDLTAGVQLLADDDILIDDEFDGSVTFTVINESDVDDEADDEAVDEADDEPEPDPSMSVSVELDGEAN